MANTTSAKILDPVASIERRDVEPGALVDRRPMSLRSSWLAKRAAVSLARLGCSPNAVSSASLAFSAAGAAALLFWPAPPGPLACALAVLARGACNLLDGMMAIEGGRRTPLGPMFNEIPDRVSDALLIVALGSAAGMSAWGWFGALAAVMTAYMRAFGGSLGFPQDFGGPLAKTGRMAVLFAGCLIYAGESLVSPTRVALAVATVAVAVGALATCLRRMGALAVRLQRR